VLIGKVKVRIGKNEARFFGVVSNFSENVRKCRSQSHVTIDGQSSPLWDLRPDINSVRNLLPCLCGVSRYLAMWPQDLPDAN
jgi:hypothetical protein